MAQLNLNFYESYVDSPDGTDKEEAKEVNQHRLRIFDIKEETKGLTNSQIWEKIKEEVLGNRCLQIETWLKNQPETNESKVEEITLTF